MLSCVMANSRTTGKIFLFSALMTLFVFLVAEIILQIFTPPVDRSYTLKLSESFLDRHFGHMPDHDLFWKLTPGFSGIWDDVPLSVNSHGLRDVEFPTKKPAGVFRILSLGESGTFGAYVNLDETYNKALERLLNTTSGKVRYQIINGGVSSYTSFQGAQYLETTGMKLEPDIVLVYFGQNDNLPTYFEDRVTQTNAFGIPIYGRGFTDKQIWQMRHRVQNARKFLIHSALYRNLASVVCLLEHLLADKETLTVPRVPTQDRKDNYRHILKTAQSGGAEVLFLVTPYFEKPFELPPGFADNERIHICDLWNGIRREKNTYRELFSDDVHPTKLGHELIGDTIFECLQNSGLLPE